MEGIPHRYFILNKPYNMVSQFVSPDAVRLLSDIDFEFPEGTHAIGRLDSHSEGMLILTTNKKVTRLLFQGPVPHKRSYLIQVLHKVGVDALQHLRSGVSIKIKGPNYWTSSPCEVEIVTKPPDLFSNGFEIEQRIPHTWMRITLTEGKFHQIRKMVFALNHKCKRLIRVSIEDLLMGDLQPGKVREIEEREFFRLLKIDFPN